MPRRWRHPQSRRRYLRRGILLAFILSVFISFAVVPIAYLTGFVDDNLLNAVDWRVFRVRPYSHKHPRIRVSTCKDILAMGDQQVVTGGAFLVVGLPGAKNWQYNCVTIRSCYIWRDDELVALARADDPERGVAEESWIDGLAGYGYAGLTRTARRGSDTDDQGADSGVMAATRTRCWVSLFWVSATSGKLVPYFPWQARAIIDGTAILQENLATKALLWAARCYHKRSTWYWLRVFRITLTATLPVFATLAMLASFATSLWLSGKK